MSCKLAEDPASVQAVAWRSGSPARFSGRTPAQAPPAPRNELSIDKEQLAQLESARQAELVQCRHAALEEGSKRSRDAAAMEIKSANDRLAHTLRDLAALKRRIRSEAESDVVKLSMAIAKRILHRELNADPESIQGVVHAGLHKLQNREISRVRIPPSALEPVRSALERAGMIPAVTVIADPKLHNGDIVFETALGELDASIETQLQEIERGFADRLGI